jgi:N-acetylglutamate synthase-like GNAT family acetyltransferase
MDFRRKEDVIMVRGKYMEGQAEVAEVEAVRRSVFVEEYGFCPEPMEEADAFRIHAVAYDDEAVAGVGSISFDGERFEITHVAVLPAYRGKQYGDFIVRMLVNKAILANASEIYTSTTEQTCPFFETIGFEKRGQKGEYGGMSFYEMCLPSGKLKTCCGCQNEK